MSLENVLIMLGIYPNLKGFRFICESIQIILSSNFEIKIMDVYTQIAERTGQSSACVERCIRHAISKVNRIKWEEYGKSGLRNNEFLYTLALKMKQEEK